MISRQKLLEAAARVYSDHGFRGATTRRIADEAGVNEVTLFRLFGSKSALIFEALRARAPQSFVAGTLPAAPRDPDAELSDWCERQLAHLRMHRSLIRMAMAEVEKHPEMAPCAGHGTSRAFHELLEYARKLDMPSDVISEHELSAAATMLVSALLADAVGRELRPDTYPQPESEAPGLYAALFLRSIGCQRPRRKRRSRPRARGRARTRAAKPRA